MCSDKSDIVMPEYISKFGLCFTRMLSIRVAVEWVPLVGLLIVDIIEDDW